MGLRGNLTNYLFRDEIKKLVNNQVAERIKESDWDTQQESNEGWRVISQRSDKDLSPMTQSKMFKIAYYLYDKNGIGHRLIERTTDFVIGEGLTYDCSNKDVKAVLDKFWNHPINNMELKQIKKVRELGLYGEQYYPVFVNQIDGTVTMGYIDPSSVSKVDTDKNNAEVRISYTAALKDEKGNDIEKPFKIINVDSDIKSETFDYLAGESFYFTINDTSVAARGRSDLFAIADGIDAYENFLFNLSERAELLNRIIWDLELQGQDDKKIKEFLKTFRLPESNSIWGHNEKMKLSATSPDLKSDDASAQARLLFLHIMSGAGFPPHWFANSGDVLNRSTATAMDLPSKKQLKSRQKYVKWMFGLIFRFVIHQACLKGKLDKSLKDIPVTINLPKIEEGEMETIASTLVNVVNAMSLAMQEGWITKEKATSIFTFIASQLGKEIENEENTMTDEAVKTIEEIDEVVKRMYQKKAELLKGKADEIE